MRWLELFKPIRVRLSELIYPINRQVVLIADRKVLHRQILGRVIGCLFGQSGYVLWDSLMRCGSGRDTTMVVDGSLWWSFSIRVVLGRIAGHRNILVLLGDMLWNTVVLLLLLDWC